MNRFKNTFQLFGLLGGLVTFSLNTNNALAVGAVTPWTTLEAEDGAIGGTGAKVEGFTPGSPVPTVPTQEIEASGMAYVLLTNVNDWVSWTNPVSGANAIVIRSSIPDSANGGGITNTLDMYVDGTFRQSITLSAHQSWNYRGAPLTNSDDPGFGTPWHFYNEDHTFITGSAIAAGSVVKLQKDSGNTSPYYKIDCIDLENVPAPITQPPNSLSVVSYGADPTCTTDSTVAIQNCINVAETSGQIVWIPQGTYMVNNLASGSIGISGVTVQGAGMWYSTLYRDVPDSQIYNKNWRSTMSITTNTVLEDFALDSDGIYRESGGSDYAAGAVGTNWLVQRIWARHCGPFWMGGSYSTIRDCRVSDSWADGINLNDGNSTNPASLGISLTSSNNFVRGCGDDGLSTYSDAGTNLNSPNYQMQNTHIMNSSSIATYWANGLRIGGGTNVVVQGNLIDSVAANNGIEVSVYGSTGRPLDSALVSDNMILRSGGWNGTNRGGIDVGAPGPTSRFPGAATKATITNNIIQLPLEAGLSIGSSNEDLTIVDNQIDQPSSTGIWIESDVKGTGLFEYDLVEGLNSGQTAFQNDSSSTFTTTVTGDTWSPAPPTVINITNAWAGYNNNFLFTNAGYEYHFSDTQGGATVSASTFWQQAEKIELAEDAYVWAETYDSGHLSRYNQEIEGLCDGFVQYWGDDWSADTNDDDLAWACTAFIRAYAVTGTARWLNDAETNHNTIWSLGEDTTFLGGGIWQNNQTKTYKNSAANWTFVVAGYLIDEFNGHQGDYQANAETIYNWAITNLYNPATGRIYDGVSTTTGISTNDFSYNHGIAIGAASESGDGDTANQVATYMAFSMTNSSYRPTWDNGYWVLPYYGPKAANDNDGGYNGIALRWLGNANAHGYIDPWVLAWAQYNVSQAWTIRDAQNLMWNDWIHGTPGTGVYSWDCSSALAGMFDIPMPYAPY